MLRLVVLATLSALAFAKPGGLILDDGLGWSLGGNKLGWNAIRAPLLAAPVAKAVWAPATQAGSIIAGPQQAGSILAGPQQAGSIIAGPQQAGSIIAGKAEGGLIAPAAPLALAAPVAIAAPKLAWAPAPIEVAAPVWAAPALGATVLTEGGGLVSASIKGADVIGPQAVDAVISGPSGTVKAEKIWGPTLQGLPVLKKGW